MEVAPSKISANNADNSTSISGSGGDSTNSTACARQSSSHLHVLPASANWYCAKVCDWSYIDVFGVLLAFGAKNSIFIYRLVLDDDSLRSSTDTGRDANGLEQQQSWRSRPAAAPANNKSSISNNAPTFVAHLRRGRKDQRVTALQFLRTRSSRALELQLVCGAEDGSVQVWDVATLTRVDQQRKHSGVEVTAVAACDPLLVVAGDRQGRISVWQRDDASVALFTPIASDCVFAIAIAPHDKALAAVGYRSGAVVVVDVTHRVVRHRLAGHDQEVQSVAWRAAPTDSVAAVANNRSDGDGVLLATASRDRRINVWRVATTATDAPPELEQQLLLPKPKQAASYNQSKRLWLPIAWSNSSCASGDRRRRLWSGSFDGNLLAWEWSRAAAGTSTGAGARTSVPPCKPVVVKNGHSRLLFNIVALRSSDTVVAAAADAPSLLLTMSLDRDVRVWHERVGAAASALQCCATLVGLGGHVYSVAVNAHANVVAAGVGDQTIRLWSIASLPSSSSTSSVELLWKGLQSKVTCVAWSPFERSVLAFGTADGAVGIVDVASKKTVRFHSRHASAVLTLQWRVEPLSAQPATAEVAADATAGVDDSASSFVQAMQALESAQADGQRLEDALRDQEASGRTSARTQLQVRLWSQDAQSDVLEFDPERPTAASTAVALAGSTFAWTARGDRLAVGRANGVVEVLTAANDVLVTSSSGDTKAATAADIAGLVVACAFHEHEQRVACAAWRADGEALATGSLDGRIVVWHARSSAAPVTLTGHTSAITSLCWQRSADTATDTATNVASHVSLLASSSTDGSACVWNVETDACVSCFVGHTGRVLSLDWVDTYALVSGGDDQTIRVWDYRVQPTLAATVATPSKQLTTSTSNSVTTTTTANVTAAAESNGNADALLDTSMTPKTPVPNAVKSKRKAKTTVFHTDADANTTAASVRRCHDLLAIRDRDDSDDYEDVVQTAVADRLAAEAKAAANDQDWERLANVHLLRGDIGAALRVVANEQALTPSWLALAPMAGVAVWRELTLVYAQQLDARGDTKNAALHYLSIGKTRAAVAALARGHAFDEALALAQSRLGARDPLVATTLFAHSAYLEKLGRYGDAALALLAVGTAAARARAVVALVKTCDVLALATAVDVLESLRTGATDSDWSVPSGTIHGIVSASIRAGNFALAARASEFLGAGASSSSSTALYTRALTATRITRCFLSVAAELTRHGFPTPPSVSSTKLDAVNGDVNDDNDSDGSATATAESLPADVPADARAFLTYLVHHSAQHYSSKMLEPLVGTTTTVASRRAHSVELWCALLTHCCTNGFEFSDATADDDDALAAQELLMDAQYFASLLTVPLTTTPSRSDTVREQLVSPSLSPLVAVTMRVAHCLVQLLLDIACGYLLSALERLRGALAAATEAAEVSSRLAARQLAVLLLPSGFVDPEAPPRMGELAVEVADAQACWRACHQHQCVAVETALRDDNDDSNGNDNDNDNDNDDGDATHTQALRDRITELRAEDTTAVNNVNCVDGDDAQCV